MSINRLIWQNLKQNAKSYSLYVFSLIFTAALYFTFVTLQYDPSMDATKGSIRGGGALKAASVLLIGIVTVFLLYANTIFIKRRSKEIGLFQLIGMTKGKIFRILTLENFILYFSSIAAGILVGFSFSKLILLILFKATQVDDVARLSFSTDALFQTFILFTGVYFLIMLMNYLFIKKQTILSLFRVQSTSEGIVRRISFWEIVIGLVGIALVSSGYYESSRLFNKDYSTDLGIFLTMLYILGSVILGTYFFYKSSVRLIFHLIRKKKDGYLSIRSTLSLSSIMFRMKTNAFLLTIITTVSALAIGLLSLSYISYYSAQSTAQKSVPNDFVFYENSEWETFTEALRHADIPYSSIEIPVYKGSVNAENITSTKMEGINVDITSLELAIISEENAPNISLNDGEAIFVNKSPIMETLLTFDKPGEMEMALGDTQIPFMYLGTEDEYLISNRFTISGFPVMVVDEASFDTIENVATPSMYYGIDINEGGQLQEANQIFFNFGLDDENNSQQDYFQEMRNSLGLTMFIVGYLGLAFLISSGCILYFKQMDESEEEQPNYTILRKLGFTEMDLLKGIQFKQLFNFGIPLSFGLMHSYFAVKSGWFFFGTEMWTPMVIVMLIYTILYSIFGMLSILYYKKIIRKAL
ncbi:ABC transporter permease [Sutcliffiella rhizosphaerae]|nr:ABC transporter permease [Sutcliffiella rhizosphaerae]